MIQDNSNIENLKQVCQEHTNKENNEYNFNKYLNKCHDCMLSFAYLNGLRNHLQKKHNMNFETENMMFSNAESK